MDPIAIDGRQTIIIAILALYLGKYANAKISILRKLNIPDPIIGGLSVSILFSLIYLAFGFEFEFAADLQIELLIVFFTALGLSTTFETMRKGGKLFAIFAVAAVVFMILQNGVGGLVAYAAGLDPLIGLLGGSVSMAGGPGIAAAWASVFESDYGIASASEVGIAFATVGMVLGGVLGGPVASRLVKRHKLTPETDAVLSIGVAHSETEVEISYDSMLRTILTMALTIGIGTGIHYLLDQVNFNLPTFAACLIGGILVINLGPLMFRKLKFPKPNQSRSLALISELSIGLALVMSLMTMQLWTLASVGPAIFLILAIQTVMAVAFAGIVLFRLMGSDYESAAMASGFVGVFLGVTSTGLANISAAEKSYGAAPRALLIIPLIGAFVVELTNPIITQLFIQLFS
ncbi:glutamate:Na+ symporter, ESS family [Shimia gijangensis]|uniref:Sodium/glutamate symporter n=1 Tax=Shimia gijangensis TaxID=1470563 RepID=A0A1M6DBP9_9RHOB|nr:sodium/glutamate symporter [Shimia gijangensis]SHI70697.1 glutamate:Na+ symporter, ESS family [Shimia gijangensis]